jgi:hypothetical protein
MSVIAVRPVVSRIADELYQRLMRLTAGYSVYCPVVEVIRPTRLGGYTPKNLQIVLTKGSDERVTELDCPGNPPSEAHKQIFNIRCHVLPSEKDTTAVDELCEVMEACVKQVVVDATRWHDFASLAINAEWLAVENIDSDGSFDGVNVPIAITYRTDENNPFNVRA